MLEGPAAIRVTSQESLAALAQQSVALNVICAARTLAIVAAYAIMVADSHFNRCGFQQEVQAMVYIYEYVGANPQLPPGSTPCESSNINLTQVPIHSPGTPGTVCTYVMAFANDMDGAGNFGPVWDTDHFSQQNIAGVIAANPAVNFAVSLGGGNATWVPPGDPQSWVTNAVNSITGLMQTYGLVGVDIDYEQGPDGSDIDHDSFVQCMSQVILQFGPASWSIAPFGSTLETYLDLYDAVAGSRAPVINFQAYAGDSQDPNDYFRWYTNIKNDSRVTAHGAAIVGFGLSTDTVQPLGLQYPEVTNLCFSQFQPGSTAPQGLWDVAMIWSLEHSCLNGYPAENALSGPPPATQ